MTFIEAVIHIKNAIKSKISAAVALLTLFLTRSPKMIFCRSISATSFTHRSTQKVSFTQRIVRWTLLDPLLALDTQSTHRYSRVLALTWVEIPTGSRIILFLTKDWSIPEDKGPGWNSAIEANYIFKTFWVHRFGHSLHSFGL